MEKRRWRSRMRSQQEDGFQILTPSRGRHIRYPSSPVLHSGGCVQALPRTAPPSRSSTSRCFSRLSARTRNDVSKMRVRDIIFRSALILAFFFRTRKTRKILLSNLFIFFPIFYKTQKRRTGEQFLEIPSCENEDNAPRINN